MNYSYTNADGRRSLVVVLDTGNAHTIPGSHPKFTELLHYLGNTADPDDQHVRHLIDFGADAADTLQRLSDRVTYRHNTIRFDGEIIDTALTRHLVRMIRDGDDRYTGLVRFMENLAANPSRKSRQQLFTWLTDRDMTITPDGCFIGYKGVQNDEDNHSMSSGRAAVNGTTHIGHIPNPPGAVVEMPRTQVSDDRHNGCTTGLHVGTWDYASAFGPKTLIVSVNPRDVVSVPKDCGYQKLRTCRYTVLDAVRNPLTHTTYQPDADIA